MYSVKFSPSAKGDFRSLDKKIQRQIANKLDKLAKDPNSLKSEKIKCSESFYRIRSGDYRIIYEIFNDELIILVIKIGHRRDIYDKLK